MKIIPALFTIGFICSGAGIHAFSFTSLRSRPYDLTTFSSADNVQSMPQRHGTKSRCILSMKEDRSSSIEDNISRRSALRQFGSFCLSTIASTQMHQQPAQASSFSDSPISNAVPRQELNSGPLPTQFAANNVVVPSKAPLSVPSSSASNSLTTTTTTTPTPSQPKISETQVKLENSQIVTIPTVQKTSVTPSASTPSPSSDTHSTTTPKVSIQSLKQGAMPEIALATFLVGSIFYTFNGRTIVDNTGNPKVKVVMVQPEPYGMDAGRRYWNGVDVTINDPVPPADIREVCDAGVVTNECVESITGFLGEVGNEQRGADVTQEQVEKATAVANYLESLSKSKGINGNSPDHGDSTSTAAAFYSYLNEVSTGNLPAPSSAASVASYLDAVDTKGSDSLDGYQRALRLSAIESKMNQLEERVETLPSEIVSKMQDWQQGQDLRLSSEIRKIRAFLIQGDQQQQANGEDNEPELVQKMTGQSTSNLPFL